MSENNSADETLGVKNLAFIRNHKDWARSGGQGAGDSESQTVGRKLMTTTAPPSRDEVNAKLEAVEARLETRLVTIDAKLDRIFERVEVSVEASRRAEGAADQARQASATIKWNIFFSFLGGIALIIAIWALWTQGMETVATLLQGKAVK